MIEASLCVICEGAIIQLKRALVAPFLAKRIWNRTPFCVSLVKCETCGFMFYNPRLDDDELRRLYGSYRSEEYQKMRHASSRTRSPMDRWSPSRWRICSRSSRARSFWLT